ncbi:minor capsid protein VP2 [Rhinolophus ferrumequinum polyomavirus 2]|nr:minor capsid protein VP2 [Rhinolophus ferrumequinum polyomavirus 2]
MGGVLSIILDLAEITTDLSTATGATVPLILSGEAAAAVEAEVSSLMVLEAMSPLEALAAVGITTEQFSLLHAVPGMVLDAVGLGMFFQTFTGASALVAAGLKLGLSHEVSVVNQNMALSIWRPEEYWDVLFPGVQTFAYSLNVLGEWATSIYHAVTRQIWDSLVREGHRQIGRVTSELAYRSAHSFHDTIARIVENARWVLTTGPSHVYSHLEGYYSQLPGINPPQARALARRLNAKIPDRYSMEREAFSGELIEHIPPPGGAHQRVTPDWLLPLILGLYGDITPAWGQQLKRLEEEEDGPQKKRKRRRML